MFDTHYSELHLPLTGSPLLSLLLVDELLSSSQHVICKYREKEKLSNGFKRNIEKQISYVGTGNIRLYRKALFSSGFLSLKL